MLCIIDELQQTTMVNLVAWVVICNASIAKDEAQLTSSRVL
jgi:hypothetical protein